MISRGEGDSSLKYDQKAVLSIKISEGDDDSSLKYNQKIVMNILISW